MADLQPQPTTPPANLPGAHDLPKPPLTPPVTASPSPGGFTPANEITGSQAEHISQFIKSSAPVNTAGEVEDIFSGTDRVRNTNPVQGLDIKASTQSSAGPVPPPPIRPLTGMGGASPQLPIDDFDETESSGTKRYFIIGIVGIIVIVGGYFVYKYFFSTSEPELPAIVNNTQDTNQSEQQLNDNAQNPPSTEQPIIINNDPIPVKDADNDGLSDAEELALGTNPLEPDSDRDTLYDREELRVYLTDPLNPDTDGDGYLDGEEIRSGFDPKGPGRLINDSFFNQQPATENNLPSETDTETSAMSADELADELNTRLIISNFGSCEYSSESILAEPDLVNGTINGKLYTISYVCPDESTIIVLALDVLTHENALQEVITPGTPEYEAEKYAPYADNELVSGINDNGSKSYEWVSGRYVLKIFDVNNPSPDDDFYDLLNEYINRYQPNNIG